MTIKEIQNWLITNRNTFNEKDIEQLCLQIINKTIQHIEREAGKGISGIKSTISHKLIPEYFQRERPNEETTCNHNYIETLSEIDDHKTFQCLNCGKIQDRCDGPN